MKKIVSFIITVVMIIALVSCGESIEQRAKEHVEGEVMYIIRRTLDGAVPGATDVTNLKKIEENYWEASGKASYTDLYGKKNSVGFEGTVKYDKNDDDFDVKVYFK